MKDIKYLLKQWEEKKASREELEALNAYVRAGEHDPMIRDFIDQEVMEEFKQRSLTETAPKRSQHGNTLFHRIRARLSSRIMPLSNNKTWRMAAAATVVIAVTITLLTIRWASDTLNALTGKSVPMHTLQGKQHIKLPDGTTVMMNEGSILTYNHDFNTVIREVCLTGEAYFDVAHNPGKPFKVITGDVTTTVLGTAFNVNASTDNIAVTVARGKVEVANHYGSKAFVMPDEQIVVNPKTHKIAKQSARIQEALAWTNDFLVFENATLEAVAAAIATRYKVKVLFENEKVKHCRVTTHFVKGEQLSQVLTIVNAVNHTSYTIREDGAIVISGEGCEK